MWLSVLELLGSINFNIYISVKCLNLLNVVKACAWQYVLAAWLVIYIVHIFQLLISIFEPYTNV
jgi:hypothetical protein